MVSKAITDDKGTPLLVEYVLTFKTGGRIEVERLDRIQGRLDLELTKFFLVLLFGILALRTDDSDLIGGEPS